MKVKPVDPTAIIRDPHTQQPLPAEGGDVPENSYWTRRLLAGEIERVEDEKPLERGKHATKPISNEPMRPPATRDEPTGHEPIAPLTTRTPRS